jgi:hypothetical protein
LLEHFPMLAGQANRGLDLRAPPSALVDDRRHFDGLGPGSEDQQGTQHAGGRVEVGQVS